MSSCSFCLADGGEEGCKNVMNQEMIQFICRRLKIDFEKSDGPKKFETDDPQPTLCISLCSNCGDKFEEMSKLRNVLISVKEDIRKLTAEIRNIIFSGVSSVSCSQEKKTNPVGIAENVVVQEKNPVPAVHVVGLVGYQDPLLGIRPVPNTLSVTDVSITGTLGTTTTTVSVSTLAVSSTKQKTTKKTAPSPKRAKSVEKNNHSNVLREGSVKNRAIIEPTNFCDDIICATDTFTTSNPPEEFEDEVEKEASSNLVPQTQKTVLSSPTQLKKVAKENCRKRKYDPSGADCANVNKKCNKSDSCHVQSGNQNGKSSCLDGKSKVQQKSEPNRTTLRGLQKTLILRLTEEQRRQIRMPDSEDVEFACELCPCDPQKEPYRSIFLFKLHIEERHSSSPPIYSCLKRKCGKRFAVEILLKKHILFHEEESTKRYGCTDCDAGFIDATVWNKHVSWHEKVANTGTQIKRIFHCKFCIRRSFVHFDNLRAHEIADHSEKLVHSCTSCEAKYSSSAMLTAHSKVHVPDTEGRETASELDIHLLEVAQSTKRGNPSGSSAPKLKAQRFKCVRCRKTFITEQTRKSHECNQSRIVPTPKSKIYTCERCPGKMFKNPFSFLTHCLDSHEAHENEKTLTCTQCSKKFATSFLLEKHIHNHKSMAEGYLSCEVCEKSFKPDDLCGLELHKKLYFHSYSEKETDAGKQRRCSVVDCGATFTCLKELVGHHYTCHQELFTFNCKLCDNSYSDPGVLETHTQSHADNIDTKHLKAFVCNVCDVECKNQRSLRRHFLKHTIRPLFTCPQCHKKFKEQRKKCSHMTRKHGAASARAASRPRPYICEICGRGYTAKGSLTVHSKWHERLEECSETCEDCGLKLPRIIDLESHRAKVHNIQRTPRVISCNICQRVFKYQSGLFSHTKLQHGPPNFSCYFCGKGFYLKDKMRYHLNAVHTTEKPYICHICHKGWSTPVQLAGHMKYRHKKDGDYFPNPKRSSVLTLSDRIADVVPENVEVVPEQILKIELLE